MSAPVVFLGLLAHRYAAATQWSAPVTPGGGSADFDHRPLITTVRSAKGSKGFRMKGKLPASSTALSGTQYPGAMPWGTKMPVKRVFGTAAVLARGVCAGTMESRNGNASVIPAPRKNARLWMCFLVMNISLRSPVGYDSILLPSIRGDGQTTGDKIAGAASS